MAKKPASCYFGNVKLAIKRGKYHPFAEHAKLQAHFEKHGQHVPDGKFHKLARKLEATLPRGYREKGDPYFSTTAILLELTNEEKAQGAK